MSFNLNDCDEACWGCIKRYKCKHELKRGSKFGIKCKGIPKNPIQLSLLETLPEDEKATAKSVMDPVEWAKENLDWHCFDED
ncbi:MAG: hypothetical protein NWE76_04580, partial [Candidatus Bathyarchaeota archaeon]|nr:hypothetical protein [Candidatus Bathyarchaeota archaeon]